MAPKREVRRLPTRRGITEFSYSGRNYSRRKIAQIEREIKARFPNKEFLILLPYEYWKPGKWTPSNDNAWMFTLLDHYDESQMPDDGDPDYFNRFLIYMRDPDPVTGGCDPKKDDGNNDCLYQCLYYAYGTFSKLPKSIEKPELLKQALGLQRTDPIPISCIDKVEYLARTIAINIVGDVTRISTSTAKRRVTLTFTNGHYSIAYNPDRKWTNSFTNKPKNPIVYQEDGINNIVRIYDGKSIQSTTIPELRKLQSKALSGKWCYVPVSKDRNTGKYESLEEAYKRIHEERNILLEESKKIGLSIDLFMHNASYKKTALWLFERLSIAVPANELLDPIEAKWISDTMMGGVIWADNDWKGNARQYDITSLYPSIQQQSSLTFPIGKGKLQTLKDFINHRGYSLYGIFRAKVEYKEEMKSLFRYSYHNKYTHIDLIRAKKLGLEVKLIQDALPNALVYEAKTRISGNIIFGEYVNFLFKLKNKGGVVSRVAKRILNTLWGALCQRNKTYHTISADDSPFDFPEGKMLESIIPVNDKQWVLQFSNPGNLFKGEYPRIAPFILAQGRKVVSQNIEPYKDQVRRVHTDGFILEEKSDSLPLITCLADASKTLGSLKYEKEGKCHIKNANQVIWDTA